MCGICGIINFSNKPVEESLLLQMMKIMKHRGPDDQGTYVEDNIGLGFVRLSIIDLSPAGHQPMFSDDGRYVIVFNGEIYNYIEIREELKKNGYQFKTQTDTEVLLKAYIHWGENCLHRFNGMWSFVIFDLQTKKIFASRDRYGIKPFYYLQTENYFVFSSDIPPLLSILDHKPKPDYQSIYNFLVFNRTDQTERTFFEEIKKLQHGCTLYIEDNKVSIKKWYDLRERVANIEGFSNPQEFRDLFSSSIGLRLRSDVPVGVCLSGGLDSSSIVSILLNDYSKKDLNTFSAVYNTGQLGDETKFVFEFRPYINNMFFIKPDASTLENDLNQFVKVQCEPIPDTSPYAQFKVMELAKGNVVVTLDGQGADEEFAGYHDFFGFFFQELFKQARIRKLIIEMYYYLIKHHSLFGIKTFLFLSMPFNWRSKIRVGQKGYLSRKFIKKYQNDHSVSSTLYSACKLNQALLDYFDYKLEHLLKWEDRNSMWFSLEARVPFLDYRLVEKVLATSGQLKIKKGITKYLLREAMKKDLPDPILKRIDKVGFETPEDEWFRTQVWQEIITNLLNSKSFKERYLINPEKAITLYQKHLSGKHNISKEIWKWVHLELWFREFID